ncbi:MAG: hypothetical protein ABR549_18570 [Mycobacteriales bacterium]
MSADREDRLHAAVWAFHAAVQRRDGIEARLRRGELDADLQDRSLSAAEAVVEARIALYRLLISEGWVPPQTIVQDMEYDDQVLREASLETLVEP